MKTSILHPRLHARKYPSGSLAGRVTRSCLVFVAALGVLGVLYRTQASGPRSVVGTVAAFDELGETSLMLREAMIDMEEVLLEMTQSVEHMKEVVQSSPRVQALLAHHPREVATTLNDSEQLRRELQDLQRMFRTLKGLRKQMHNPEKARVLAQHVQMLLQKAKEVEEDPEFQDLLRGLEKPQGAVTVGSLVGLLPKAAAFQAPLAKPTAPRVDKAATPAEGARAGDAEMIRPGEVGVLPPLGVFDPLGLIEKRDMIRYNHIEIKHGRLAMAACLHIYVTKAGFRWPGYLSDGTFGGEPIKFSDVPDNPIEALFFIPGSSWAQIIILVGLMDKVIFKQEPDGEYGNTAPKRKDGSDIWWVRAKTPEGKQSWLNIERQNGRAAMFGILGMFHHEAILKVDPLFPMGGIGGGPPPHVWPIV
jgi:hypothetical protein